jgi:hypothetical protein
LLKTELIAAVNRGDLDPRIYALIYEWSFMSFLGKEKDWTDKYFRANRCVEEKTDDFYNINITKSFNKNIDFVNYCRKKIGMCIVEHDELQKQFEKDYGLLLYFGFFKKY